MTAAVTLFYAVFLSRFGLLANTTEKPLKHTYFRVILQLKL
jgi:hypothetical protein